MGITTSIALSGLLASAVKFVTAANNIANAQSENYQARDVETVSSVDGVEAIVTEPAYELNKKINALK